jgi:hypothetical protein
MKKLILITLLPFMVFTTGCVTNSKAHVLSAENAVKLRSFQTRDYNVNSKKALMRAIVAVLQDLSFIVDKADMDLGTVTATKLDGYFLTMSITVREKANNTYSVRSNINYQDQAIEEPQPYQDFFSSLDKSVFLQKNKVDEFFIYGYCISIEDDGNAYIKLISQTQPLFLTKKEYSYVIVKNMQLQIYRNRF